MKKLTTAILTAAVLISSVSSVFAAENNVIKVHGEIERVIENSMVINDSTMVPIREIADALGLSIIWFSDTQSLVLWNDDFEFRAKIDSADAKINDKSITLAQPPCLKNGLTYLPLRSVSEVVNAEVKWDSKTGNIDIYPKTESKAELLDGLKEKLAEGKKIFYSQRQPEWGFENGGSGYCWVCAYAMALTETLGEVITPDMVAEVNKKSGSGAFMQHGNIAEEFGISFTPAIDETSEYFKKYESWKGATYINAETDEQAVEALKEALDKNPQGIMVRYTVYPHTLYAVGYSGDEIYFNEPAYESSEYVTFEQTCLKKYNLRDMDFIQAIKKS